jgi:hypothetical protein
MYKLLAFVNFIILIKFFHNNSPFNSIVFCLLNATLSLAFKWLKYRKFDLLILIKVICFIYGLNCILGSTIIQ